MLELKKWEMKMVKSNRSEHRCTRSRHGIVFMLLVLGVASLPGCGNGLSDVSGHITLNGQPLVGGGDMRTTVYFFPEGGTGAPAVGLTDEDGNYEIQTGSQEGVMPGSYLVTISASKLIPPRVPGEAAGGKPLTPRKYANPSTSGLRVEVAPGSNEFDFALEGNPPGRRRR